MYSGGKTGGDVTDKTGGSKTNSSKTDNNSGETTYTGLG